MAIHHQIGHYLQVSSSSNIVSARESYKEAMSREARVQEFRCDLCVKQLCPLLPLLLLTESLS